MHKEKTLNRMKLTERNNQPLFFDLFDLLGHDRVPDADSNLDLTTDGLPTVHEGEAVVDLANRLQILELDLRCAEQGVAPQEAT